MADEWLRAGQVADAKAYFEHCPDYYGLKLVEQDARWRALVGVLLTAIEATPMPEMIDALPGRQVLNLKSPKAQRVDRAVRAAQAALDGAG